MEKGRGERPRLRPGALDDASRVLLARWRTHRARHHAHCFVLPVKVDEPEDHGDE